MAFDMGIERVARGEGGVTQLALQIANTAVRLNVILQSRFCLDLEAQRGDRIKKPSTQRSRKGNRISSAPPSCRTGDR